MDPTDYDRIVKDNLYKMKYNWKFEFLYVTTYSFFRNDHFSTLDYCCKDSTFVFQNMDLKFHHPCFIDILIHDNKYA